VSRKHFRRICLPQGVDRVTVKLNRSLEAVISWGGDSHFSLPFGEDLLRWQLQILGKAEVEGFVEAPAMEEVPVTVDESVRGQSILGFGGIGSPMTWKQLSAEGKREWLETLQKNNWLIQREYPTGYELHPEMDNWDREEDALPHYYGDNFPVGEISDFEYNRKIQELGGEVWFEFWYYPPWVQEREEPGERNHMDPSLFRPVDPEAYCRAMVGYCQEALKKTGKPPSVVGIQNEISPTAEDLGKMVPLLRRRLDEAGFEAVKIHMANASLLRDGFEFLRRIKAHPEAWEAIDYIAVNMYDAQEQIGHLEDYAKMMREFRALGEGKVVLSPEISVPHSHYQLDSYRLAAAMAELFHYNMVDFEGSALCFCWTLLHTEQHFYEATRSLSGLDVRDNRRPKAKGFIDRVFNIFSRSLPRGSVRLGASAKHPDLLVSAWQLPEDKTQRVIAFNRGNVPLQLRLPDITVLKSVTVDMTHPWEEKDAVGRDDLWVSPGGALILDVAGKGDHE